MANVIGSISYESQTLSGSNFSAHTDFIDGAYYIRHGYAIMTSEDNINWTRRLFFQGETSVFTKAYDLSPYKYAMVARAADCDNPNGKGIFYLFLSSGSWYIDYSTTALNTSNHQISNTLTLSSTPAELSITVNPSNGIGFASSVTMETQVIHSIQGIASGIGGALSTTVQLLDILQISGLASGIGSATGIVQVVSSVNRIIKGVVNLDGSARQGATVIAVEPTLMKSYKATTLADGTYEVFVNDVGTYHVLAVYEDNVGNKYGAMIQPYVMITE